MASRSLHKRIDKLAQQHAGKNMPLAVISTIGLSPEEAESAIATRRGELKAAGYVGPMIVLDM